jgi:hypothetical protein
MHRNVFEINTLAAETGAVRALHWRECRLGAALALKSRSYQSKKCEGFEAIKSRFVNDKLDWFVGVSFSRFEGGEKHQSDYELE